MKGFFVSFFALALFLMTAPAFALMEDYPSVKLQGLDKSVGRTTTFEAKVGSTIQYGPLFIKIDSCRKAPPIEKPESATFLQIWEVPPGEDKSEWVFSGWMFASSPALSAMDHPVYDVWVLDCLGKEQPNEEARAAETQEEADQTNLAPIDNTSVSSPAGVEAAEKPIPTDSEAEEKEESAPTAQNGPVSTDSPSVPVDSPKNPALPEEDKGVTAYDFMEDKIP